MTDEQYDRIWTTCLEARQTARQTMLAGLTPAELKAAYDADDAALAAFHEALSAARTDITIQS